MTKSKVKSGTFTQDQLQMLGCLGRDVPPVPTSPPPLYPSLSAKPAPIDISPALDYKLLSKDLFLNYMRDSSYHFIRKNANLNGQRYSDQYAFLLENRRKKSTTDFPVDLFSLELKNFQKRISSNICKKVDKKENIKVSSNIIEKKKYTVPGTQVNLDSDAEQENEVEDDEMDDEIDYGNNYFDNGEAFNEEDDNIDDGPIY